MSRIAHHLLHPALAHFPIACWSLAVVTDFASVWLGETAWHWSAGLLTVGCVWALAAMLAGLMELHRVPEGVAMRDTYATAPRCITSTFKRPQMRKPPFCQILLFSGRR
ncbi:DUF2231 domain-containing protein [Pusillimonas sp. ANT_WB101]|uniref:DUF2231 domain-containing protein n=1 Tax=Pusillimonas sp. ANT_WB101 TaxID=2597356 RepID=UPI003519F81A